MGVRRGTAVDVEAMVELADVKRQEYAQHGPLFQRPASEARQIHRPWLTKLTDDPGHGVFVHENDGGVVDGFAIVAVGPAPPVYDPGGMSSLIDDFAVASQTLWESVGSALLDSARQWAMERGAVQVVVVCGPHDGPKRAMLAAAGLYVASEWFTAPIDAGK